MHFKSILIALSFCTSAFAASSNKMIVFIGTYTTGGASKGIYSYELDLQNGALRQIGVAAESPNPSFLAIHPNKRFLYAVNELEGAKENGLITGFSIDAKTGKLNKINETSTGGPGPCFVSIDKTGKFALAANYAGGSVCVAPINSKGELGPDSDFIQHTGSSVNKQARANRTRIRSTSMPTTDSPSPPTSDSTSCLFTASTRKRGS